MNLKGVILRLILSIEFFAITPMILAKITDMNFELLPKNETVVRDEF